MVTGKRSIPEYASQIVPGRDDSTSIPKISVLCACKPDLCQYGKEVNERLSLRKRYSTPTSKFNSTIFVHNSLTTWYGAQPFLTSVSLERCLVNCTIVEREDIADIVITNMNVPSHRKDNVVYAAVNLEAHSHNLPQNDTNVIMLSFHPKSDL